MKPLLPTPRHSQSASRRHPGVSGLFALAAAIACRETESSASAASPSPSPCVDVMPGVYPNQLSGSEAFVEVALTAPADRDLAQLGALSAFASATLDLDQPSVPSATPVSLRDVNGDGLPEALATFSIAELEALGIMSPDTTRLAVRLTASGHTLFSGTDRLFGAGAWLVDLPTPSGPEPVGTTSVLIADDKRASPGGGSRKLMLRLWYPAAPSGEEPTSYFLDEREAAVNATANAMPANIFDRMHRMSVRDAMPSSDELRPTLLMSTGWSAPVALYASIAEDLASHGYVVIGMQHPDGSGIVVYPDGSDSGFNVATPSDDETVEEWARDFELVLDWLPKARTVLDPSSPAEAATLRVLERVDMNRLGSFGHSFGGAAAVRAAVISPLLAASANVDGSFRGEIMLEGPVTPVLTLLFDGHTDIDPTPHEFQEHAARGPVFTAEVLGAGHNNFTDYGALAHGLALLYPDLVLADQLVGSIDPGRALEVESAYLRAFFGAELSGEPTALMNGPSSEFPEVNFSWQAGR